MNAYNAGRMAEQLVSPQWREAVNGDWQQSPEAYATHQAAAEQVMEEAVSARPIDAEADWEARRLLAMRSLDGTEFGLFANYMHARGGSSKPSTLEKHDLGEGEAGPVRTNYVINRLNDVHDEPIDFLEDALAAIQDRRKAGPRSIGPENYATALKYFTNKYVEFPSKHLDRDRIAEVVGRACEGFTKITTKDKPNFVELTNVFQAVRILPRGSFPDAFTKTLVSHSLEQLPTFHKDIARVFYGAVSKLPATESVPETATLLDLAMRQFGSFETTTDMRTALRAVRNLPMGAETDHAFATFLELRNNLEEPLDLEGAEEVNELLFQIVSEVTEDLNLVLEAKNIALANAQRAVLWYKRVEALGDMSAMQLQRMRQVVYRISACASNI